jgi:uncharacterized protein
MGNYVLITGATSGIGYEMCLLCAKKGHNLVLTGRNAVVLQEIKEELSERYHIMVKIITADLSLPDSVAEIYQKLKDDNVTVGILINNAGFGKFGPFSESNWVTEMKMIQVNIVSLTCLTKLILQDMLKRNEGRICNIASTAGFRPGPLMAVYFATKAYVLSFSEAIAEEVRGTGVSITTFCPGATKTNFNKTAGLDDSQYLRIKKATSPRAVAVYCYKHLMRGDGVVVHGYFNRILLLAQRFVPRKLVSIISRIIKEKGHH